MFVGVARGILLYPALEVYTKYGGLHTGLLVQLEWMEDALPS